MSQNEPDRRKRDLFDLLRDPERLGREFGDFLREIRRMGNEPTVSPEEYEEMARRVAAVEAENAALHERMAELEALREQDQETIRDLWRQIAELAQELVAKIRQLEQSRQPQDQQKIPLWKALLKRLGQIAASLFSVKGAVDALRDTGVQEFLWPLVKELPQPAQERWQQFVEAGRS